LCSSFNVEEKGRATALLKSSSKRKRNRSELEEVKEEEKMLKENKQEFLRVVKHLKNNFQEAEAERIVYQSDHDVVENLMRDGYIDVHGNRM
jgi:signal transduction histidine kinase